MEHVRFEICTSTCEKSSKLELNMNLLKICMHTRQCLKFEDKLCMDPTTIWIVCYAHIKMTRIGEFDVVFSFIEGILIRTNHSLKENWFIPLLKTIPKMPSLLDSGWNNKLLVENGKSWTKAWHETGAWIEEKDHMFMNAMQ